MKPDQIVYTAQATATGGRDGRASTPDGRLDVKLAPPREMGGNGDGANPEQLFACGYAACFLGAIRFVAARDKLVVPAGASITAAVGIGPIAQGFGIQAQLRIRLPGIERARAQALVDQAHIVCPYSNATRGNIEVTLIVE